MIDTYGLLMGQTMTFLGGFLIGIGLKTIIDGFARRDELDGVKHRLNTIEDCQEDIDDDLEGIGERIDALVEVVDEHTDWIEEVEDPDPPSKDDVDAAVEMLRPPGELPRGVIEDAANPTAGPYTFSSARPPIGDYAQFLGKHGAD